MQIRFPDEIHLEGNLEFDDDFHALGDNLKPTILDIARDMFAEKVMEKNEVEIRVQAYNNENNRGLTEAEIRSITSLFIRCSSVIND